MNTIELFAGTKSFSKVAKELGHSTLTIDNDKSLNPDVCCNILNYRSEIGTLNLYPKDILWASPPCTSFSIASCSHHWICSEFAGSKFYLPKSKEAETGLELLRTTIKIIKDTNPKIWFIENPRGLMRKVINKLFDEAGIKDFKRVTVTYCQYGDTRMKPTDIWTNDFEWIPKPMCKNGNKCHESAPRGSRTGTQGLKNAKDRGVIPRDLFIEIFNSIKEV